MILNRVAASVLTGLALSALLVVGAVAKARRDRPDDQPNIVVIVADDLGYGDLSAYGAKVSTPNIDALARDGARFTQAYATAAVCSPSRAGLMTGRYQQRFGHEYQIRSGPAARQKGIATDEPTLGRRLQSAGYRTGLVGKWHLGADPERHPLRMGFDSFFGFLGGETDYIDPTRKDVVTAAAPGKGNGTFRGTDEAAITRQGKAVDLKAYTTDAFSDEAVGFIRQNRDRPFLLVVTYNAPHTPLQATRSQMARMASVADPSHRLYRAVVNELDRGVGRIRAELDRSGLTRRTLVVFVSDNGCPDYVGPVCSNAPLSGYKRLQAEGGIRVPMVMAWPGQIPAGQTVTAPSSTLDIAATALALAGARPDPAYPLDGADLMPYLTGKASGGPHERLFWKAYPSYAVREGDWKLLANLTADGKPVVMLFDLAKDPAETRDLAVQYPEVVKRLQGEWDGWNRTLPAPRWPMDSQFQMQIGGRTVKATI